MLMQRVSVCSCDATPPIKVENTPAYVCEVCSDQVLPASTIEVFERIRKDGVGRRYLMSLEVVNFDSAEKGEVTSHESHEFYTPPMPLLHTNLVPDDSTTAGRGFIVRPLTHSGTARV